LSEIPGSSWRGKEKEAVDREREEKKAQYGWSQWIEKEDEGGHWNEGIVEEVGKRYVW